MDYQHLLFGTKEDEFEKVMKTFNVSQEILDENLEKLRKWIKSQPHLCHLEIERSTLKRYLFGKMFSLERAKSRIEKVHIYRALLPQIFSNKNVNVPILRNVFDFVNICIIPQKLPDNGRIVLVSMSDADYFDAFSFLKLFFMISDLRIRYETHSYSFAIIDCANANLMHFVKFLAYNQLFHVLEDCYEDRIKTIILVNFPEIACSILTKIKSFMKKSVAEKIQLHKDTEKLKNLIPLEYLPSDYGGKQMSCRELTIQLREAMSSTEMSKWYSEQEKLKSNETQRVKNNFLDFDDFSCLYGTFRRIDID